MTADFEVAVGRGHAGAALRFDRSASDGTRASAWPAVVALALTLPFVVALLLNSVGVLPTAGRGLAVVRLLPYGPVAALAVLGAARVRLHAGRRDGQLRAGLSARLLRWEVGAALAALLVVAVFFGHLAADALACANGVTRAC